MTSIDWIGAAGVFLILLAYFLNVIRKLKTTDMSFILMNLAGASLACLASWMINYMPFVILEGTWAAVSVLGMFRILFRKA